MLENKQPTEKAVLVALITQQQSQEKTEEYLNELEFLSTTAGAQTVGRFSQRLDNPDTRFYVGKGKLEEIKEYCQASEADLVIFDDDLSPSQVRNLEQTLKLKILDRSLLILNIFSLRAKTAQAKTQVELAQYQYMLPRLTRMWTHLSKQKGGIGMRGPGETELETDRRIVRDKIALLRKKLDKIEKQSQTQRKNRSRMVRVALVGYTNVGKSSLMKSISKSEAFAENKLFATVDSLVRKVVINRIPFLLTDTVGFIRKLPTMLIESFKSTLDEIREADIVVHVVDLAHPAYAEHISIVNKTLADIGVEEKPMLTVFNKVDLVQLRKEGDQESVEIDDEAEEAIDVERLADTYSRQEGSSTAFISVKTGYQIDALRYKLYKMVRDVHYTIYPNFTEEAYHYYEGFPVDEEATNDEAESAEN